MAEIPVTIPDSELPKLWPDLGPILARLEAIESAPEVSFENTDRAIDALEQRVAALEVALAEARAALAGLLGTDGPDQEPGPPRVDPPSDDRVTPNQFASADDWLDAVEAGAHGYIPEGETVDAGGIRDRVLGGERFFLTVDGALSFGGRHIGLGVNTPKLRVDGKGKISGARIAFLASPDASYDGATGKNAFKSFVPRLTTDLESVHLGLQEWDGCNPFVLLNTSPWPPGWDAEKSKYRLKSLFFDGWCHDAVGGLILETNRFGDASAMTVENGAITSGAPVIEILGQFTNIDGRPMGKESWAGRAIAVGVDRGDDRYNNGGVYIKTEIDGVLNDGFGQADGNETQGIIIQNGVQGLIEQTNIRNVRHAGATGDLAVSEQKLDKWGKPVNNCEGLYDKYPGLWVVETLFENCDGAGFDAGAWTSKGPGPSFGRNLTARWTRDDWAHPVSRIIRCNNNSASRYAGIRVEGYGAIPPFEGREAAFWASDGDQELRVTDYTILP